MGRGRAQTHVFCVTLGKGRRSRDRKIRSQYQGVWKTKCFPAHPSFDSHCSYHLSPETIPSYSSDTKGLYFQAFGGRRRCLSKSVAPMLAHGYRRFLPTKDHVFILDYVGTLFFLKNALVSSTLGQIQWKRACRYVVLCRGAKDVSGGNLGLSPKETSAPSQGP